jgi:hypothetical protein
MKIITVMSALVVIAPGVCSSDELIRCGNSLVSTEMSAADLLSRCGRPTSQSVSTQELQDEYGTKVGTLTTETWRYDGDSKAPAMVVTIVDGQVQRIERSK